MEICDRCFSIGDYRPSTKKIETNAHESFGLCESCYSKFKDFLSPEKPKKKRGKPQKSGKK